MSTKRRPGLTTPGPTRNAQTPPTEADSIVQRWRCIECNRDLRLRPFRRLRDGRLVCRRCFAERWAAR
jgi:formylmethanofuran dehydrogenase subunit E